MAFAGQDSVPHIVPVFLAFQAAQQGCKGCLVNETMVQGYSNIHFVKGVVHCAHQLCPLHKLSSVRAYNTAQAVHCYSIQCCTSCSLLQRTMLHKLFSVRAYSKLELHRLNKEADCRVPALKQPSFEAGAKLSADAFMLEMLTDKKVQAMKRGCC